MVTIQEFVDGQAQGSGNVVIRNNLEQDSVQLRRALFIGDGTLAGGSNTLKGPWLRARLGGTTADHALSLTGSESAGDTTNSDTSGKVIQCDEGG
jgi:hypothetical protein